MQRALALILLFTAIIGTATADVSDYAARIPLIIKGSLNGDMFTNETEILTPRGIIDGPSAQMQLTQQPPAESPDPTEISPAAGPDVSETLTVSPTGLPQPESVLPVQLPYVPTGN